MTEETKEQAGQEKTPEPTILVGKGKVLGQLTISIIDGNPTAKIDVENKGMNPYMIPTILRQLAQNFEETILESRSLIE